MTRSPRLRVSAGALLLVGLAAPPLAAQDGAGPDAQPNGEVVSSAPELVVLVHGLGRSRVSMMPLQWALERAGYDVLNWGYSSVSAHIPELGERMGADVARAAAAHPGRPVHFVGHSMGNILIRWVLVNQRPVEVGRVVMLAPPNQGARAADRFAPWMGWILRPLPELTTGDGSTARSIPAPVDVRIGIIAGAKDAKVSVEETRLAGADEHIVVKGGHTFLMARPNVQRLVLRFLTTGDFDLPPGSQAAGGPGIAPLPGFSLRYQ